MSSVRLTFLPSMLRSSILFHYTYIVCRCTHTQHIWRQELRCRQATCLEQSCATRTLHTTVSGVTSKRFYPRDAMLARVIAIATCLSVSLCVTRRYCVKTKKASGMISSPSGSPKTLVFWRQISSPHSKGFPPNGGFKQRSVGKI